MITSDTALALLQKYGRSISATRTSVSFTAATGNVSTVGTTSYSGYGYPSQYSRADIDGQSVLATDTLLLFMGTLQPEPEDTFVVGSKTLTAVDVKIISVNSSNILYKVQLRQ